MSHICVPHPSPSTQHRVSAMSPSHWHDPSNAVQVDTTTESQTKSHCRVRNCEPAPHCSSHGSCGIHSDHMCTKIVKKLKTNVFAVCYLLSFAAMEQVNFLVCCCLKHLSPS